jgi:2-iminobutanoate/2-iminopropanoate deaminase
MAGEAVQAIKNISAILSAAGGGWEDVAALTVYLVDKDDFACFNSIYAANLPAGVKPARTTVMVKALPLGAKVEMTAVARLSGGASELQDG